MEGLALSAPVRIAGCDAVSLERSGTLSRGGGVRRGYDGKSTHVLFIIITIAIKSDDGAAGSRSKLGTITKFSHRCVVSEAIQVAGTILQPPGFVLELLRCPSSNQVVGPANGLASLRSGTWRLEVLGEHLSRIGLVCLFGLHCKVAGSPHCSNQLVVKMKMYL